ncbi:unnamed protein product [Prunus armeniaca]
MGNRNDKDKKGGGACRGGGRGVPGVVVAPLLVLVFAGILAQEGILVLAAQEVDTSCLNRLAPCLNYLNGTRHPPDNCCDPLKWVIKSNPECLCRMISNRGSNEAEQAGINVNEAQELPGRCGQRVNPLVCLSSNGSPNNSKNSVPNSANSFSLLFRGSMAATTLSLSLHLIFNWHQIQYSFSIN